MRLRVGTRDLSEEELAALEYLLYPYEAELNRHGEGADVLITRDSSDYFRPLIRLSAQVSPGACLRPKDQSNGVVDLPSDLIRASSERFEGAMNPRVPFRYKLAALLPFSYRALPSSLRSLLLKMQTRNIDSNLSHHLANETVRRLLIHAFDLLGFHLSRKTPPSLVITHDVETEKGLERAPSLKRVEDHLNLQSTWFLPTHEFLVKKHLAAELADGSRIGSHDIKHDGRLILIKRQDQLVERLKRSRIELEAIIGKPVRCFRSPLLQFSRRIVLALAEAGYEYDFSAPCWEPVHPSTLGAFGVECVQPFKVGGVVESPLTLFQDHQVLNVMGMSVHEAIKLWVEQASLVRSMDGDTVLLIHPDYLFSQDLESYRELLSSLLQVVATDSQCT